MWKISQCSKDMCRNDKLCAEIRHSFHAHFDKFTLGRKSFPGQIRGMPPLICQMLCFTFTASTLWKVQCVTRRLVASCNIHKLNYPNWAQIVEDLYKLKNSQYLKYRSATIKTFQSSRCRCLMCWGRASAAGQLLHPCCFACCLLLFVTIA